MSEYIIAYNTYIYVVSFVLNRRFAVHRLLEPSSTLTPEKSFSRFDKQERMYLPIYMGLPTARTRDNWEMAQNGTKWHIYNKEKPWRRKFMHFPVMPCAT